MDPIEELRLVAKGTEMLGLTPELVKGNTHLWQMALSVALDAEEML